MEILNIFQSPILNWDTYIFIYCPSSEMFSLFNLKMKLLNFSSQNKCFSSNWVYMGCLSSSCATEQYPKNSSQKSSTLMLESLNVPLVVQLSKLSRDLFHKEPFSQVLWNKGFSDVKGSLWNHLDKKVLLWHREAPLFLRVKVCNIWRKLFISILFPFFSIPVALLPHAEPPEVWDLKSAIFAIGTQLCCNFFYLLHQLPKL